MSARFTPLGPVPDPPAWRAALVLAQDGDGRVLVQLRDDRPAVAAPGTWGLFGGAVEQGETLSDAACREWAEETGHALRAQTLFPLAVVGSHARPGGALYAFRALGTVAPRDLRLGEGAGFAFLTRAQLAAYPLARTSAAILAHAGLLPARF